MKHISAVLLLSCLGHASAHAGERLIFADEFGVASRGERVRNIIVDPEPIGLGYTTDTPFGFLLRNWIVVDQEAGGSHRGFWVVPERADGTVETYAQQAGRSRNSICFAGTPLPAGATHYDVEFKQWSGDNDPIAFIVGASEPSLEHDGGEFSYMRQIPGTDDTVDDIYYDGAFGKGKIVGKAMHDQWAAHRIAVRGTHVAWFQNGEVLLAGEIASLKPGGYFGIRQRYERGTRYDDVRIVLIEPMPAVAAVVEAGENRVDAESGSSIVQAGENTPTTEGNQTHRSSDGVSTAP